VGAQTTLSGLLCTLPRSGSWLLCEHLYSTGLVGTPEEYFRPDYLAGYRAQWGVDEPVSMERYIELCLRHTSASTGVFTAKIHWYQMDWLCRTLREDRPAERFRKLFGDVRYVHLVRRDSIRQALSWYRAIRSNSWFDLGDGRRRFEGVPDLQQVRWLEDTLHDHGLRWREFFRTMGVVPHVVDFTEVVDRPAETVRSVLAHLGIDPPEAHKLEEGRLVKQSDGWTDMWERAYLQVRDALPRRDDDVCWSQQRQRFVRQGTLR